ncbi:lysophospholipase [Schnuerera sp. xch1]|uniref:alpha/beta hydrolase n=1 Tax=Schnuerera sp. xch1 TaxID=2874283 RepID=UPI001CBCC5C2|nr:alpha/beta fold hydrolase [Schnuerera sp. xch1]MBZ2174428.1 lysophospholipase [Schnuerera sp. xch1]
MNKVIKSVVLLIVIFSMISIVGCSQSDNEKSDTDTNYIEEEYNLETSAGTIFGTLMMPEDLESSTVAVIIAGSGPTDRDGNNPTISGKNDSLKMIAEALANEGISSVRYDKRGIGESAALVEKEEDLIFEDYINDVVDWVDRLKEDTRFDKVVIIGHSEGALIGATAAYSSDVDGFVSIAGMGYSAYDTLARQLKEQSEEVYQISEPIIEELKQGNLVDDVPEGLHSLFRPSVQPYMISWFKYNPVEEISKIEKPILIIQGDNDIQITIEDAELLNQGNPDAELVILRGMNHILKDAPEDREENLATYSDPELPLNQQLIEELTTFINEL